MALKFRAKSKDEIPADQQAFYVERDGAWVLDVDGAVDPASVEELRRASKARLEEFRQTNVTLMRERDELKQRFERSESDQVRAIALAAPAGARADRHLVKMRHLSRNRAGRPSRFASAAAVRFLFAPVKSQAQVTSDVHCRQLPADCGPGPQRFGILSLGTRAVGGRRPDPASQYYPL